MPRGKCIIKVKGGIGKVRVGKVKKKVKNSSSTSAFAILMFSCYFFAGLIIALIYPKTRTHKSHARDT